MRHFLISVIAVTLSMLPLASGAPSVSAAVNAPALSAADKQSPGITQVWWRYGYRHRWYGYRPYRHYGYYRPYWRRWAWHRPYRYYGYYRPYRRWYWHRPYRYYGYYRPYRSYGYWRGYGYRRHWRRW